MHTRGWIALSFSALLALAYTRAWSQQPAEPMAERFKRMSVAAEKRGLAEPYKGITAAGAPESGLFPVRSTGVSTEPVRRAAEAFLAALTADQRKRTVFPVDDDEWRKWMNQHFYVRQGVSFEEMTRAATRSRLRTAAGLAERAGLKLIARHHAPQPHARRVERQRLRRVRRVALPHHRDGHALGDRALGLADRRPPPRSSTTSCSAIRW